MSTTQPLSLAELQRAFASLSTRGDANTTLAGAGELVQPSATLTPSAGMQIYANMFIWRQIDSLLEDFPKLAALTADAFYPLCQAYLAAHPSRHHSLAQLGRQLTSYLATRAELRADLSDMAALEWARWEVFEEAAVPTLSTPELTNAEQGLSIIPALRALWLKHDVGSVWKAIEEGALIPAPQRNASCYVVWRKSFEVFHVRVDPLEAEALARAAAGAALSQICETFADEVDPLGAASRVIGSWFSEGWIAQGDS